MSEENGSSPISQRIGGWATAVPGGPIRWRLTWWKSLVERVNAVTTRHTNVQECHCGLLLADERHGLGTA